MATAQRPNSGPAAQTQTKSRVDDAAALLEQMVQSFTPNEVTRTVYTALSNRIETLRDLLPDIFKSQAERFVKRAMLEFEARPALRKCTKESFIKAVLDAAECGLAIDGKLAYAVPYDNRKKDEHGNWYTVSEANFQPSYMGVVAVAKRIGLVLAVYGDTVCKNDRFQYVRRIGDDLFEHERPQMGLPRGDVVGAYQKIVLPGGLNHIEVMDVYELDAIMNTSKSFKSDRDQKTPWNTNRGEMQKKTVIHRAFKMYQDDPGMMALMKAIESDFDHFEDAGSVSRVGSGKVGRSTINDRLIPTPQPAAHDQSWPKQDDDPFAGSQSHHDAQEGVDDIPDDEDAQDPAEALREALAACKTKSDVTAVAKRFMVAGLDNATVMKIQEACDLRGDELPLNEGKAKQKSAFE